MKKIKVGVIGVGNMGSFHSSNLNYGLIDGAELAAVCDIDSAKLQRATDKYPYVQTFDDYKTLCDSKAVDAVIIAVPHKFHSEIAIYALNAGLHVLTEKPIDITVTAAKELIKNAETAEGIFAIMLNQRTNKLFQKAREIVSSGELGQLKRSVWIITNWYRTQHYYDSGEWRATWSGEGGGVLLNQAPHNLDLWQWICGMPSSVTAFCDEGKYHRIEVEDDAAIYARYPNGAAGIFITSTGEYPGTNRLEISGDRGKIVLEGGKLKHWKLKESEREFCFTSNESFPQLEYELSEITCEEPEAGHIGIVQNFVNAILFGEKLLSPGKDGLNELMISNAAYLSSWKGNAEIELPIDGREFDILLAEKQKNSGELRRGHAADSSENHHDRWKTRW